MKAVTATPTIVNKSVVSAPYRDLGHRGRDTAAAGLDVVKLSELGSDGMMFETPTATVNGVTAAVKDGVQPGLSNTNGILASLPDNVTHVPPRQVDLFVSYWSFVCSDGIDKLFPVDDVVGWGPTARN